MILLLPIISLNKQSHIEKQLNWYENSGHVITLGSEKEQLHEDILNFLESLDWNVVKQSQIAHAEKGGMLDGKYERTIT